MLGWDRVAISSIEFDDAARLSKEPLKLVSIRSESALEIEASALQDVRQVEPCRVL